MSTTRSAKTLDSLFERLDALERRASVDELGEWLRELDITVDDVDEHATFNDSHYVRNLMHGGEHYHAVVLCWHSGQRSPIHNHAESTCGLMVLKGTATETVFEHTPCGQVKAISSRDLVEGEVCVSQDDDTHQVSNLQPAGQDLITLHIYTPPLLSMDSFSLTSPRVTVYRPTFHEHLHGSGI